MYERGGLYTPLLTNIEYAAVSSRNVTPKFCCPSASAASPISVICVPSASVCRSTRLLIPAFLTRKSNELCSPRSVRTLTATVFTESWIALIILVSPW